MQLTSTTDTKTSRRSATDTLLSPLNHPIATGLITLAGWLAFVLARWQTWAAGRISLFIMAGHFYSGRAHLPHVPSKGYDGQFYYRLALNPFNWHPTAYGIAMDHNYRYTRIGYPLVAWIGSLGQHRLVPAVLVLVNLVCVAIIGWLGGKFARESGRHALWGLLFVGYFGLVISVGRDTSEPLADACMLGGLLAYRHSRYVLAALLVTYGVVTNEPILVLAVAIALTRLYQMYRRSARPGAEDLVWVLPGAAYLALQGVEHFIVKGKAGGVADATANLTLPFRAMVPAVARDIHKMSWTHLGMYDINLIEFIALATVVVAGLLVLRSTTAPLHERVAFAGFVLVEMVIASGQFWDSVFGDGRTYIDAFLLAVIMLLATPARPAETSATTKLWGLASNPGLPNTRLGWLAAVAASARMVAARRRILFQ